jgi:hypothetical protein
LVLASGALAFFPFIIVILGLVLLCGASALVAWTGDGPGVLAAGAADGITTGGSKLVRSYYGLLWRLRLHPVLWGAGAGLGLGAALLAGVLWFFVVPREAETLAILLEAKAQLDAAGGPKAKGLDSPRLDAFERPIQFRREGSWLTASYVLTSLGFDGKESADDICVSGRSRAGALLDHARHPLETLTALREGGLDAAQRAQALRATRCDRVRTEESGGST